MGMRKVYEFIMKSEGVDLIEAMDIWAEEITACNGDYEEALYNLGMELDYIV